MNLTLIITTYNWPEALILVLKSIKNQTICETNKSNKTAEDFVLKNIKNN